MKTRKKYITIILAAVMCIQTACGSTGTENEGNNNRQPGKPAVYVTEDITLPEYSSVEAEYTHGNILYYAVSVLDKNTQAKDFAVYTINMESEPTAPMRFPAVFGEQETIQKIAVDENGMIYVISGEYSGDAGNPDIEEIVMTLRKFDGDGKEVSSYDISHQFQGQEYPTATGLEVDEKGNVYFSSGNAVSVLDEKGAVVFRLDSNGFIYQLVRSRRGKILAAVNVGQGTELNEIAFKSKSFEKRYDITQMGRRPKITAGKDADLLVGSESGVYDYDTETREFTEKFEWSSCYLVPDTMGSLLSLEDGRILFLKKDMKPELFLIREAREGEEIPTPKKTLTYGGISVFISATVKQAIADFNKNNPDYQIEIKEYAGGFWDHEEALVQLNLDVISGNCPDILQLPLNGQMDLYVRKGVLEDLYPYIDRDDSISRVDFVENVIKAYEVDGKLYSMPLEFSICTLAGKASVAGDRAGWTLDEMIAFADSCPKDTMIFADSSKSGVLRLCMTTYWKQLVNWEEESFFDRDLFIKILQFASRFIDDDKFMIEEDGEIIYQGARKDELLVFEKRVRTELDYDELFDYYGLGPVSFVGYPAEDQNGYLIDSKSSLAIRAKCPDKDVAWEFISSLLTEECQERNMRTNAARDFSIMKDMLERQLRLEWTPNFYGSFKEEDTIPVRELIASADTLRTSDRQINTIIAEEAPSFFSGIKSAEEVADVVENRIRIYVNEIK